MTMKPSQKFFGVSAKTKELANLNIVLQHSQENGQKGRAFSRGNDNLSSRHKRVKQFGGTIVANRDYCSPTNEAHTNSTTIQEDFFSSFKIDPNYGSPYQYKQKQIIQQKNGGVPAYNAQQSIIQGQNRAAKEATQKKITPA